MAAAGLRRLDLTTAGGWRTGLQALTGPLRDLVQRLPAVVLSIPEEDAADHEHRRSLRSLVEESPGVHLSAAADSLDVPLSTVRHHVRALERRDELVTSVLLGRRRLFAPRVDDPILAALHDEGGGRLLGAIVAEEPATGAELAETLDLADSTVSYHLERLADAGIVERERRGNRVLNRLSAEARSSLADYPEVSPPATEGAGADAD